MRSATKACSWPLESSVPKTAIVMALMDSFDRDGFEFAGQVGEGFFNSHALKAGGTDEADGIGVFANIGRIFRSENRAAVGKDHDVFSHRVGGIADRLSGFDSVIHRDGGVGHADRSSDGAANVGNNDIGAGFSHTLGFFGRDDVRDSEKVHLVGQGDHFDLLLHTHAGFFESLAIVTINDGVGREVVHAREAHVDDLTEKVPHAAAGVGGVDSANDGDLFDDGKDLKFPNLHCDGIGITIGHEAGGGARTCHAESSGIVDDDEVGAAFLNELG